MFRFRFSALVLLLVAASFAQFQAPLRSPEVHADRRVTFRFKAPNAKEVNVNLEGSPKVAMTKGEDGVWTATTDPLEPDMYGYSFQADGVNLIDPGNSRMKGNLLNTTSLLHVPSADGRPWELRDVPRGALHHHFFQSKASQDRRDFYVYTPPGYDPTKNTRYPVLYLLHGYSDDASGWSSVGQAHVILDNLIAQRKAKPMLVVMPLGYGTMEVIENPAQAFRSPDMFEKNFGRFRDTLLTEIIPMVESSYRVQANRQGRALAGLSMGGAETLYISLNASDRFNHIAAFSFGGLPNQFAEKFPEIAKVKGAPPKTLWITCGVDDRLIGINRQFSAWLKEQGVEHTFTEGPGSHTWMVWRRNLADLAPTLF